MSTLMLIHTAVFVLMAFDQAVDSGVKYQRIEKALWVESVGE